MARLKKIANCWKHSFSRYLRVAEASKAREEGRKFHAVGEEIDKIRLDRLRASLYSL